MEIVGNMARRFLGDQLAAKLFGAGLSALLIKVTSAGLSYLMLVAFARLLGPEQYGHFGVMLNVAIVLSTVVAFGLPTGIMRFWAGHVAKSEVMLAQGFNIGAQKFLAFTSSGLIAFGLLASSQGWWKTQFGMPQGALLVALLASAFAFGDYYANALRAQDRVFWSMLPRDVFWRIAAPIVAVVAFHISGTLHAGSAIFACLAVMAAVSILQALVTSAASAEIAGEHVRQTDWTTWRQALWPMAGASILYAMVQQLDVVVVGSYLGAAEAGAYFAAQKTASLLGLVMIAGGLVAAPMMSAAFQSGRRDELQRLCKMLALAIAVVTFAGLFLLVLIGKSLLSIFDPAYQSAYTLLLVLALGYTIDALAGPTGYLMQMTSLEGAYLRIMAVTYAIVLVLQIVFIPIYGAIAAAMASATGVALWNLLSIFELRRRIGVDSSILSFFMPPKPR
jgi:O-antigen/teichoic acid export membrane protein